MGHRPRIRPARSLAQRLASRTSRGPINQLSARRVASLDILRFRWQPPLLLLPIAHPIQQAAISGPVANGTWGTVEAAHGGVVQRGKDAVQATRGGDGLVRLERACVHAAGHQLYHLCGAWLHRITLGTLLSPEAEIPIL